MEKEKIITDPNEAENINLSPSIPNNVEELEDIITTSSVSTPSEQDTTDFIERAYNTVEMDRKISKMTINQIRNLSEAECDEILTKEMVEGINSMDFTPKDNPETGAKIELTPLEMKRDTLVYFKNNLKFNKEVKNFKREFDKIMEQADIEMSKLVLQMEANDSLKILKDKLTQENVTNESIHKIKSMIDGIENSMNLNIIKKKIESNNLKFLMKYFDTDYIKVKNKFMAVLSESPHPFRDPSNAEEILERILPEDCKLLAKLFMFNVYRLYANLKDIPLNRVYFINYFILNLQFLNEPDNANENSKKTYDSIVNIIRTYFIKNN